MRLNLEQRNEVIVQYMPLANQLVAERGFASYVDREDLLSAAYLGLVEAASRYDTDRGEFAGYAAFRMKGEIKSHLRSLGLGTRGTNSRGCHTMASLADEADGESYELSLVDKKSGDLQVAFDEITEQLTSRSKDIMWQYFVEGRKMAEIGDLMGIKESWVSQIISQCRKTIAA